ncbi:MAG: DUF3520 domain-containing protein, partial [Gemmataceae bacterium]
GDVSKELSAVLSSNAEKPMSEDFRFAAAVAEFGLVLRDSPYKGNATIAEVQTLAESAVKFDPNGHRKEFLDLVRTATGLKQRIANE